MDIFKQLQLNNAIPPLFSKKGSFVVDDIVGSALLIATAYKQKPDNYLIIASNLYKAQQIYNFLTYFLNQDEVLLFPADELIRAEFIAQSKEMVAQRLYVLNSTFEDKKQIIVTCVAAASRYLPAPSLFRHLSIDLKIGDSINLTNLKKKLILSGYSLVSKVDASLQFAVRGDILDIFSVNTNSPIRIEFFGDEIESIRTFDIVNQTSLEKLNSVSILPGSDMLLSDDEIAAAPDKINKILLQNKGVLSQNAYERLIFNTENDLEKITQNQLDQRVYKYYSFLSEIQYSIFDYTRDYVKVFIDETQIFNSSKLLIEESWNYLNDLFEDGKNINHLEMYQDIEPLIKSARGNAIFTKSLYTSNKDIVFDCKPVPFQASKKQDALNIIQNYLNESYKVILCLNSKDQQYTTEDMLTSIGLSYERVNDLSIPTSTNVGLSTYTLPSGFVLSNEKVVVLTSLELFNTKIRSSRFNNKFKEATILKSFEDLNPGDYIVHEYQGIGQFLQLETVEIEGVQKDFLKIAFAGDSTLYVPLNQFQLVRKYMGKEGYTPKLSRLHSKDWENTKKKIKERINELATRLMHLYIERSKVKGFAFAKDDEFQLQFENEFKYELTTDQEKAVRDIKVDMENESPMDRLLCGDVGFGKTEVAFRAAFKAINSGKQVAILCPTTLLAKQHYELAMERFKSFDVKIAHLSRLVPEAEQKKYMKEICEGQTHLVIGTHRLLSKQLSFKDLGLLIIDEEQRFGVEQKEKIKEIKNNVDVLTLSATPIPRTLQISLLGVRSLSQINTAPVNRMPIQTYVSPFNFDIVKELIEREFGRNGQVFFLHNQVSTIYTIANRLAKLLPHASVGVAHGQMSRTEIEDVMNKFYNGDINLLVATSIIENGIDVPNANMIIVQDADRYGLSQLYQIKGRVGRSDRIAYAYFMYPEHKILNDNAQKRLKTLQEFTELGSGYKIAQRDLMIRGAGDILGPEQAGFIDSIGLDMYIKLLNESVQDKLNGTVTKETHSPLNLNLSLEAYIPSSYASDADKIELYQEINSSLTMEMLNAVKYKMIDIYGKMPNEVELLFKHRQIDILSKSAKVKTLFERGNQIELVLENDFNNIRGVGNVLFETLIPFISYTKIAYKNKEFVINMNKRKTWINDLVNLLEGLNNVLETGNMKETI